MQFRAGALVGLGRAIFEGRTGDVAAGAARSPRRSSEGAVPSGDRPGVRPPGTPLRDGGGMRHPCGASPGRPEVMHAQPGSDADGGAHPGQADVPGTPNRYPIAPGIPDLGARSVWSYHSGGGGTPVPPGKWTVAPRSGRPAVGVGSSQRGPSATAVGGIASSGRRRRSAPGVHLERGTARVALEPSAAEPASSAIRTPSACDGTAAQAYMPFRLDCMPRRGSVDRRSHSGVRAHREVAARVPVRRLSAPRPPVSPVAPGRPRAAAHRGRRASGPARRRAPPVSTGPDRVRSRRGGTKAGAHPRSGGPRGSGPRRGTRTASPRPRLRQPIRRGYTLTLLALSAVEASARSVTSLSERARGCSLASTVCPARA